MLSKESKIRVLENFYALDYVFFGKDISAMESCCPLVKEEYMAIKGALMSVFIEMLKLVDHTPNTIEEQSNSTILIQNAKKSATIARENAQRIVSTPKSKANIKEALKIKIKETKDIDISEVIENQIRTKAFSLAVDSLLLARVVSESKSFDKLNEWEGNIIEDSYKILRDNLIESAYELIYTEADEPDEEDKDEDSTSKLEELHTEQLMTELSEFSGFLNAVSQQLQATYEACRKTKCHKSSGLKTGILNMSKVGRACTDLCWVSALQKGIATLQSGKSRCRTARNPEKCVAKFDKLIDTYRTKIVKYKASAAKKMAKSK
ncbi:MAG: hypothetical protein DRN27_07325 [Thermoplasmata archaeon]|nr:MAG: hypothetical protein DRN27_07325 [Thermoplasmata archaeon]